MAMVFTAQIRVTKEQRERIKERAKLNGFHSMSAYLRYLGLEHSAQEQARLVDVQSRLAELHAHLLGARPRPKFKKNKAALR